MSESKSSRGKARLWWQFGYIFGTLALICLLGFSDPDFISLFSGRLPVNPNWLLLCGAAMVAFWLVQACVYAYAGRIVGGRVSFWSNIRITMFGEYYSAITPFASGGQPMQIGYYKRYGVGAAKSSSILAVRYIGFVSSVCLCYLCALCVLGGRILADYPVVFWLTAVGFLVNFFSIVMVALILRHPAMVRRFGLWVVRQLTRLRFLRAKREAWSMKFESGVVEFSAAGECIRSHPFQCLVVLLLSLVSVGCMFSVSYLVYRALGLAAAGFLSCSQCRFFCTLRLPSRPRRVRPARPRAAFTCFSRWCFPRACCLAGCCCGGCLPTIPTCFSARR